MHIVNYKSQNKVKPISSCQSTERLDSFHLYGLIIKNNYLYPNPKNFLSVI